MVAGRVFISYRSEDSRAYGALLHAELSQHLGPELVFLDSESISAGSDFADQLLERVRSCRVLLAVIGPRWLFAADPKSGRRRIDEPGDWIRRELTEAFATGATVIPVLTDGAHLPAEEDLPDDIAALSRCQYRRLRHRYYSADLGRILADLMVADPELAAATRQETTHGAPQQRGPGTAESHVQDSIRVIDAPPDQPNPTEGAPSAHRPATQAVTHGATRAVADCAANPVLGAAAAAPRTRNTHAPRRTSRRRTTRRVISTTVLGALVLAALYTIRVQDAPAPPVGRLVFFEDFAVNVGWMMFVGDRPKGPTIDGTLKATAQDGSMTVGFSAELTKLDVADAIVQVDVTQSVGLGQYGVLCRVAKRAIASSAYEFAVKDDGHVGVFKVQERESTRTRIPLADWRATTALQHGGTNRILAVCRTDGDTVQLQLWINNRRIVSVTDSSDPLLLGGTLALFVRADPSQTMSVGFDNLRVERA